MIIGFFEKRRKLSCTRRTFTVTHNTLNWELCGRSVGMCMVLEDIEDDYCVEIQIAAQRNRQSWYLGVGTSV